MNTKITFVELVSLMAEATSTSKRMCELFLREFFSTVSQALIDGESVKIKGIGTFKVTQVKPSGKNAKQEPHGKLTFTPDKSLAESLNQPFAQFETVFLDDAVTEEKLDEIDKLYPSYFPEAGELPEPPDYPMPPIPDADEIPAEAQPKAEPRQAPAPRPAEKPVQPAMAKSVERPTAAAQQPVKPSTEPAAPLKKPVKPLMGIPIDGPTQKPEKPETVEKPLAKADPKPTATGSTGADEADNDSFYRPEPRNAYSPTQEQLSRQQRSQAWNKNKRWLWIALAALATGLCVWLLSRCGGKAQPTDSPQPVVAAADSDSIATSPAVTVEETDSKTKEETASKAKEEPDEAHEAPSATKPKVVTETITAENVLFTIAKRHYGSPWFWVYIYEENKSKISNPDNVRPGTVIVIPPAEKYGIDVNNPASVKKAQRLSWELLKGK